MTEVTEQPTNDKRKSTVYRWLLRAGLIATLPFLPVSCVLLMWQNPFIVEFTVINQTAETIFVTPIGTVGKQGERHPLPIYTKRILLYAESQRGGFEIPPGESLAIAYDWDDINFSEIVVHDANGERGQVVVNANPTLAQYHAPATRRFVISDLALLSPVPKAVHSASNAAQQPNKGAWVLRGLMILPGCVLLLLLLLLLFSKNRAWAAVRAS